MKKKRKLLSLLVAFLFMFTLIPTSVYAEGSDTETKAKDAQVQEVTEETKSDVPEEVKTEEKTEVQEDSETITKESTNEKDTNDVKDTDNNLIENNTPILKAAVEPTYNKEYKYEKVTGIYNTTAKYLIVYNNGTNNFALNNLGDDDNNDTLVEIQPRANEPNYYDISPVSNAELWQFSDTVLSETRDVRVSNVAGQKLEINHDSISMSTNGDPLIISVSNSIFTLRYYAHNWNRGHYEDNYLEYNGNKFTGARKEYASSIEKFTIYKQVEVKTEQTYTKDDVKLNKTATPIEGNQGSYSIGLNVTGANISSKKALDITLVIDNSNSMYDNKVAEDNMAMTKKAAINFVDSLLDLNPNNKFSVVTYGSKAYLDIDFTNDKSRIISEINSISQFSDSSYGGTNTEAGLLKAYDTIYGTGNTHDTKRTSVVVFMTDGVPTWHNNGTSATNDGSGTSTSSAEFNEAVVAAENIKNKGSLLYSVALLYKLNTSNYTPDEIKGISSALLSDSGYYNAYTGYNKITPTQIYKNNNKTANFKKYYSIDSSTTDPGGQMVEIYNNIAVDMSALATGTVTDVLPKEYKLSLSDEEMYNLGYTVTHNEDGTTTITYNKEVSASESGTELPKFTIEPNPEYDNYGSVETNVKATYHYTMYNSKNYETPDKEFNIPAGLLNPKAEDDEFYCKVGEQYTIEPSMILSNDGKTEMEDNKYTISPLTYNTDDVQMIDSEGNVIAFTKDEGGIHFTPDKEGVYTFTYKATATATATDDWKNPAEGTVKTGETADSVNLVSNTATVTVHVYCANNKTFVVDYGKPVTYNKDVAFDGLFEKDDLGAVISMEGADVDGKSTNADAYGTMEFNSTNKSLTYRLTKFMEGIDTFTFNESKDNPCWNVKLTKTVTMIPATAIYYEDNFGGTSVINYSSNWKILSNDDAQIADPGAGASQDSDQNENYGYDSGYADDTKYSDGSVHYIEVPADAKTPETASFIFKGTGFDIISRTKADTRTIYYSVKDIRDNEGLPYGAWLDNYYSGDLYQIPVISCDMGKWSEYEVTIKVYPGYKFYLDGIRIYNPLGTAVATSSTSGEGTAPAEGVIPTIAADRYKADKEFNPYVKEIRNMLLDASNLNIADSTYEGGVFVDGNSAAQYETYKNAGPNNEVYLKAGQAVAFRIITDELPGSVQLGLKVPDAADNSATPIITDGNGNNYGLDLDQNNNNQGKLVKDKTGELKTSTEMNYEIKMVNDNKENILFTKTDDNKYTATVVIKNNTGSTGILSVTKLKLTAGESGNTPSVRIVSDKKVDAAVKLAFAKSQSESQQPEPSKPSNPEISSIWSIVRRIIGKIFGRP